MSNPLKDIRAHNFRIFLEERLGGSAIDLKEKLKWDAAISSTLKHGKRTLTDEHVKKLCKAYDMEESWWDQDRLGDQSKLPVIAEKKGKKERKPRETTRITGEIHFVTDGFEMKFQTRGASADEAELTRLALRIIEVRSR